MIYRVVCTTLCTVHQTATVEVDADSPDAAKAIAEQRNMEGKLDWTDDYWDSDPTEYEVRDLQDTVLKPAEVSS